MPATGYAVGPVDKSTLQAHGRTIGVKYRFEVANQHFLELDVVEPGGKAKRFISRLYHGDKPWLMMSLNADCDPQVTRKINYGAGGEALSLVSLKPDFSVRGEAESLNPPLIPPDQPAELVNNSIPLPIRVGMIDSGVNYRLAEINERLARDADNKLIGYDFWDMDDLPYDAHLLDDGFFVQRHGTRTASLLLREARDIELVPYRYPRPDMSRMQALVEHAARNLVTILGMPLGSNNALEWRDFERAARAHPNILFVVSAGNNGRDIDRAPVYPAAFALENMLVVSSADDFVQPAEGVNWGKESVDYLVPAENVLLLDYSGRETRGSGSSYAVARVAALAAKMKMSHRDWIARDIIAEMRRRYAFDGVSRWVNRGYIADPLAVTVVERIPFANLVIKSRLANPDYRVPLEILVLDSGWSHARIEQSLQQAFDILAQCGIAPGVIDAHAIKADDYLRDLSVGSAQTLLQTTATEGIRVVFARDTRMQEAYLGEAFGLGNTSTRPWLRNSLWLMQELEDEGIALAHELYHVIANNGEHIDDTVNLMQSQTRPGSLALSPAQCRLAHDFGLANELLKLVSH